MTQIVAYRKRGSLTWSHIFRVEPYQWRGFYRHARLYRQTMEYARLTDGDYVSIL